MLWLKGSYVGLTYMLGDSLKVQQELHKVGIFSYNAFPMGGKMVLLTSHEGVEIASIFSEFRDLFAEWFSEIKP